MSERFAASSPSSVGPLFAGSRSPGACVPVLPVPVPGVFVLVTSADVPAPPVSEPPPLPTTYYMTRNITCIQHRMKWSLKSPGMWHCCWKTNAHWMEGTTILSNMRNYLPNDTVPHPTEFWPFSNTLCLMQYQNEFVDSDKIILLWWILVIHVWYNNRQTHCSTRLVIQQLCTTYWHYLT